MTPLNILGGNIHQYEYSLAILLEGTQKWQYKEYA